MKSHFQSRETTSISKGLAAARGPAAVCPAMVDPGDFVAVATVAAAPEAGAAVPETVAFASPDAGLLSAQVSGCAGSSSWELIQAMPPRNSTTSAGTDQTSSSNKPKNTKKKKQHAQTKPTQNHHAKASVAIIVGITIAS